MPEYVGLIRTARWLGVPPWELARQSIYWLTAASNVAYAEAERERAEQERTEEHAGGYHRR